jgi:hypothetical protein
MKHLLEAVKRDNSVPKTVDELVDEYRVKLGLRPWSELGHGRRSGKTTHMMLIAIATVATSGKRVVVSFDPSCIYIQKNDLLVMARLFGVDKSMFEIVPHVRSERASITLTEKLAVFSDHYDSRSRAD